MENKIIWNENHKLIWNDFEGTPNSDSPFAASTNTGIQFGYSYTSTAGKIDLEYTVESFFNKDDSWYFPHLVNDHILSHEQNHFDISELHARKLRKQLSQKRFTKNIKNEIHVIYSQVEEERKEMQRKFDSETEHSQNFKKEAEWTKHIANQLKRYERWK